MMPTSSPGGTSRLTSATIVAPPMSSPRFRVARIGGGWPSKARARSRVAVSLELLRDRRLDVAGRHRLQRHGSVVPVLALDELDDEHRLDHRVILGADLL